MQKRSDILVFDRKWQAVMLIECKSRTSNSAKMLSNSGMYNMTVGARHVAVTNGMVHYCWLAPKAGEAGIFQEDFPSFEEDGLSSKIQHVDKYI